MLTLVDGHNFRIGSSASVGQHKWDLYQADVTGLMSTTLVAIRTLSGIGSTLLIWRLVSILLSKGEITLAELCRIVGNRLPLQSRFGSRTEIWWSILTIFVVALLWPPSFASPLANSSLTWHPQKQEVRASKTSYNVNLVDTNQKFDNFQYAHLVSTVSLKAISTGVLDPGYAFADVDTTLRRYVSLDPPVPEGATGLMTLPYFNVTNIDWFDSPSTSYPDFPDGSDINNASMLQKPPDTWALGTVGFWVPKKWDLEDRLSYTPVVYEGKRNISIHVGSLWDDRPVNGGNNATIKTPCQTEYPEFGVVPDVKQYRVNTYVDDIWRRADCYMLAEVSISAGRYRQRAVDLNLLGASTGTHIVNTTIDLKTDGSLQLEPDWAVMPTLDMMTDVMRQIYQLNATSRFRKDNLNGYVRGTLKLGYDAMWSALPSIIDDSQEEILITPLESVIRADVNKARLYGWLAMNFTLQVAACIVAIAHRVGTPGLKMTRNPTLMALMMDLNEVKHFNDDGLCNAVTLGPRDKKLGTMKWKDGDNAAVSGINFDKETCGKVVLVPVRPKDESAGSSPLLSLKSFLSPSLTL
ncbi:hypothetical protein N0V90_000451 [Kalmusia sp. IMI 367209]|nr:hypothetical protein N0V90_000451 [Kalmusia sp. IMI 367209]